MRPLHHFPPTGRRICGTHPGPCLYRLFPAAQHNWMLRIPRFQQESRFRRIFPPHRGPSVADYDANRRDHHGLVSLIKVKIINITTIAKPMRNPISWARSGSGRPHTALTPSQTAAAGLTVSISTSAADIDRLTPGTAWQVLLSKPSLPRLSSGVARSVTGAPPRSICSDSVRPALALTSLFMSEKLPTLV